MKAIRMLAGLALAVLLAGCVFVAPASGTLEIDNTYTSDIVSLIESAAGANSYSTNILSSTIPAGSFEDVTLDAGSYDFEAVAGDGATFDFSATVYSNQTTVVTL